MFWPSIRRWELEAAAVTGGLSFFIQIIVDVSVQLKTRTNLSKVSDYFRPLSVSRDGRARAADLSCKLRGEIVLTCRRL